MTVMIFTVLAIQDIELILMEIVLIVHAQLVMFFYQKCENGEIDSSTSKCVCKTGYSGITCSLTNVLIIAASNSIDVSLDLTKYKIVNSNYLPTSYPDKSKAKFVHVYLDTFTSGVSLDSSYYSGQEIQIVSSNSNLKPLQENKITLTNNEILTAKVNSITQVGYSENSCVTFKEDINQYIIVSFSTTLKIYQGDGAQITKPIALAATSEAAYVYLDKSVDINKQKFTVSSENQATKITFRFLDGTTISEEELKTFIDSTGSDAEIEAFNPNSNNDDTNNDDTNNNNNSEDDGGSIIIIAIIVGIVIVVIIVIVIVVKVKRKKNATAVKPEDES